MGEKIRIGGFDTNAATRQETITNKKKVKGYNSQTYLRGNEPKQKLQISLEEGFETLEQLEDMLSNPKFQTTKILGVKENEKVIVHNNNFKHGHGIQNHIAADTVEVKEFGVKSDVHYISKEDAWQTIIDEDFNSVNFPSAIGNGITSTGLENQERAFTYRDISNGSTTMSTSYASYGEQSVAMGDEEGFMIDNTAMYDNLDIEFTWTHTNASGIIDFYISRRGYDNSNNVGLYFRMLISPDDIYLNDQFSGRNHKYFDADINIVNNVSYTTRLVKIGRFLTAYLNGVKIAEFELLRNIYGNIGMRSEENTLYLDKLTVKTLPSKMLAFPDDSFVASESKTYETPHGKINKTFDYDLQGFEHGVPTDAKVHFDFREGKGKVLNDKNRDVDNKNDGNIRKGKWVNGYFYDAVQLTDGDILIKDSSTIKDLSEFNLHTRFKLNNLENTYRSLQANPIISRQHEFTVYDYKKPDTLVGWWKLDGDYVDSSGYENHGTSATNTSVVAGKQFTNAIDFDGTASVKLGEKYNPVDYERPQATFAAWVKLNSDVTGFHTIFAKWNNGSSNRAYGFWLDENGGKQRLHLATKTSSTTYTAYSSDFDFTTNEWAHFALTWDKQRVTFYLNGERLNTDNIGISDFTNDFEGADEQMYMGGQELGTANRIDGVIQDLRIYNSVMTNDEIKRIYNGGDGLQTKLNRHHLAFEIYGEMLIGDVIEEGEWIEAWFQSDGKSSFIFRRVGQEVVGEARKLLGDVVLYVPFDDDTNDKSVYKETGTNYGSGSSNLADKRFYKARNFDGVDDYVSFADQDRYSFVRNAFTISFWIKPDTLSGNIFSKAAGSNYEYRATWNSSRLTFNAWNNAGQGVYNAIYSYAIDAGYWHHFVITADGTSMYMYQNGELVSSIAKSSNNMGNGNQPITIGRGTDGGGTSYFNGKLDEMKFYNRAISKEEIMFLFSAGQYTSDMHIGSSKGYMPNGQRESGLITHAKFDGFAADETDHKVWFEQNNGTFVDGKIGQAFRTSIDNSYLEFIAMNDQRPIQWGMDRRTRRSYAFWVKPDGTDMDGFIISKPFNGSGQYNLQIKYNSNAFSVILWNYISHSSQISFTASNLLDADVWQHIVITFDQTEIKVYKNGEFVDRGYYNIGEYSAPSSGNLYLTHSFGTLYDYGSSTSPSGKEHHAFSADYDDLRIYNYDLDKYEIQKIYNKGNGTSSRGLNTLTMDLFSLQDKFYFPHRHVDGISQVRVWDLGYDSINNPMKKSKVFDTHNEEGSGLYTKVSNRYFSSLYSAMLQADSAQTSQWTTDTPSKFNKYALELSNQDDWILDNDHSMNVHFNDERIYEITFSVWVKKEETSNDLFLFYNTTGGNSPTLISLNYSGKGRLYLRFGDGSTDHTIHTEDIFIHPDHKWFKFDATFSYGVWKFYVDGELIVRHDASWYWFTFDSSSKVRHDGYNPDYLAANTQLHDVALTEQEIKERFIYDPVNPYFNSKQIFSKNYEQDSKNAIFVENGLFGMLIHKALPQEARRTVGGVDFYRWDNGWKSVGRLMTEKSD